MVIEFPWITVTDEDTRINGVVWRFVDDSIDTGDDFEESGLITYEIDISEPSKPENFDWDTFEAYTQSYLLRAIESAIETEKLDQQ